VAKKRRGPTPKKKPPRKDEVRCDGCGWQGRNPKAQGETLVVGCPRCGCETATYLLSAVSG
jgi:hypothetical protein